VVAFDDGPLGTTVCRLSELHLVWYPQEGHWDLVIVGGEGRLWRAADRKLYSNTIAFGWRSSLWRGAVL
jgi:hypothetical protein